MLWRGPHGGGAASGAAGTQVASHNTGGQYLKARTVPTNPNTIFQQEVRNAVRTCTSRWNTLTPEQRDAWGVYAANVTFRNRLGDTIKISGIANYVRSNTPRFQAGLPLIDEAPGTFDIGDVNGAVIAFDFGTTDGTLTLDDASDWITTNGSANTMLVYVSRPQNAGINFFKGPYRLAAAINGTSAGATPAQVITLPFPATAGLGQQLFGQVRVTRAFPFLEPFTYPNGDLTGRGRWVASALPDPLTVISNSVTSSVIIGQSGNAAPFGIDSWDYDTRPFTLTVEFIAQTLVTGTDVDWQINLLSTGQLLLYVQATGGNNYDVQQLGSAPVTVTMANGSTHTLELTYPGTGMGPTVVKLDGVTINSVTAPYTAAVGGTQNGIGLSFFTDDVVNMAINFINITSP